MGEPVALLRSLQANIFSNWGFDDLVGREANARELLELVRKQADASAEMFAQAWLRIAAMERGNRDEIERIHSQEEALLQKRTLRI